MTDKKQYIILFSDWFKTFLRDKINDYEVVDVIVPSSNLSKLNNAVIKSMPNYSSWDFKSDIVAIILNKKTKLHRLVLLNCSISALSLKEIGEINLYAKLADAEFAFLVSSRGLSSEVNLLLLENDVCNRLLNYSDDKSVTIFAWDEMASKVNIDSIMPLEKKGLFE